MNVRPINILAVAVLAVSPARGRSQTPHSLIPFQSAGELSSYLVDPPPLLPASIVRIHHSSSTLFGSWTNSQGGANEGDVVKVHGDHLVMLRRGRLFTVSTAGRRITPISAVDAFSGDADLSRTWYDEVLVSGDNVVVTGYSYPRGGMELALFRIDARGRLSYRATWHIRSNGPSSHTYASRLTGTRLVLYVPLEPGRRGDDPSEWLPAMRRWHPGATDAEFRRIASPARIHRPRFPSEPGDRLVLHTLISCELARPELSCSATGALGPPGREFYVSETAAYVWVSDFVRPGRPRPLAMLYRLPLDGTSPSALGVQGHPIGLSSFLESGDGFLNVLTLSDPTGIWPWSTGEVTLLRVPVASFADGTTSAPAWRYRVLPGAGGEGGFTSRFVGPYLLYGVENDVRSPRRDHGSRVYVTPWTGDAVTTFTFPHGIDRIEAMGSDAVVVGTDEHDDLHLSAIDLDGERPRLAQRYVAPAVSQWEMRDGFFYHADGPESGVLGLPVRGRNTHESVAVVFLRNRAGRFEALGELNARPSEVLAHHPALCGTSCANWFYNSRPLFLHGRMFALLGNELVEGTLARGELREMSRVNYGPRSDLSAR